jgi:hypothetical protein
LIGEARFVNGLILGCQWGLLASTPRLGRVKRSLTPNPKVDRAPQTPKGRIPCVVESLDRCQRRQQRGNCNRADRCSEKHGRSPVINTKGSQSLLDFTTSRI